MIARLSPHVFLGLMIVIAFTICGARSVRGNDYERVVLELARDVAEFARSHDVNDLSVNEFRSPPAVSRQNTIADDLIRYLSDVEVVDPPLTITDRPQSGWRLSGKWAVIDDDAQPFGVVIIAELDDALGRTVHRLTSLPITNEFDLARLFAVPISLPVQPFQSPHPRVREFLGDDVVHVIQAAQRVEVFGVAPRAPMEGESNIANFAVTADWEQGGTALRDQLTDILFDEKSYRFDTQKRCGFQPGVAFRFPGKDYTVSILICFTCSELMLVLEDRRGQMIRQVVEDFDTVRAAWLRLIRKIAPADSPIHELPLVPESMNRAMTRLRVGVSRRLIVENVTSIQCREWSGPGRPEVAAELTAHLRDALQRVNVDPDSGQWTLQPRYELLTAEPATAQLSAAIINDDGEIVLEIPPIEVNGIAAEYLWHGSEEALSAALASQRRRAFEQAIRAPVAHVNGREIRSSPESPYGVRVQVACGYHAEFARIRDFHSRYEFDLRGGIVDSVILVNRSSHDAIVSFHADSPWEVGLISHGRFQPERHVHVPRKSEAHVMMRPRKGVRLQSNAVRITALFRAAWSEGAGPPNDESPAQLSADRFYLPFNRVIETGRLRSAIPIIAQ